MPKRRTLDPVAVPTGGRGLAVLAPTGPARLTNAHHLPILDIDLNPQQSRQEMNEAALGELADSIRQYGVLEPILVRPVGERWEIVAGERRYRAAVLAGHHTIPALLRDDLTEQDSLLITATENLQREDLSVGDEARQYARLQQAFQCKQPELARLVGVDHNRVWRLLKLLREGPDLLDAIDRGDLTLTAAMQALAAPDATTTDGGSSHGEMISAEATPDERVHRTELADPLDAAVTRQVLAAFKPVQRFARAVARLQPADVPPNHREDLANQLDAAAREATLAAQALRQAAQSNGAANG